MSESVRNPLILSVCETALGGVGRYQENLRSLEEVGYRVAILMPDADAKILEGSEGVSTFRRDRRSVMALARLVAAFFATRRRLRPDLYFFNSTFSLLPLLALRARGDKTPSIYCAHCWAISNYQETSVKGRIVRFIEGRLCGLANVVVNVSHGDAALAARLGYSGHQVVVENAVREPTAPPAATGIRRQSGSEINLLFVGRFDRQKGLDVLLGAFDRARRRAPHLRLHLVGNPVRGSEIPRLPDGVTHHGWVSARDIDGFYASADALVVPSRWEGLPLIVPEALRNGTPVFVSDNSDMGTLVVPSVTGGVFDLTEQALADCLSAMSLPKLQAMRKAARESYEERFAMKRFLAEMSMHMAALLNRKQP